MLDPWKRARTRYEETPLPEGLEFAVSRAIREGEKKRRGRRALRRSLMSTLAGCACFALLVNASPTFAQAVSEVPVLRDLARVFTAEEYSISDRERLIDVRLPALDLPDSTDLEQRINTEIRTRIEEVLQEAEDRARETRDAYVATGGDPDDFMPVIISVDYEVKCQNDQYLSFLLTKTETRATAYTEVYAYNIDLEAGREIDLKDLLSPDWRQIVDQVVTDEIARQQTDPDKIYFEPGEGGFEGVRDDQPFYLDESGQPVVFFEKYEIAPGYMGMPEFTIPMAR